MSSSRIAPPLAISLAAVLFFAGAATAAPDKGQRKGADQDHPRQHDDDRHERNRERRERKGENREDRHDHDGARHDRDRRAGRMLGIVFRDITLSEEQREQVRAVHEAHRAEVKAWHTEHQDQIKALRAEMKAAREDGDRAARRAAAEKFRDLMETRPKPDTTFTNLREVLTTDEDRATFDKNVEELRRRMAERRDRAHGPDGDRPRDGREGRGKSHKNKGEGHRKSKGQGHDRGHDDDEGMED